MGGRRIPRQIRKKKALTQSPNRGDLSRFYSPTIFIRGEGAGIDFSDLDKSMPTKEFVKKLCERAGIPFSEKDVNDKQNDE